MDGLKGADKGTARKMRLVAISKVRRTSEVRRTCRVGSYPRGLTDGLKGDRQRNRA